MVYTQRIASNVNNDNVLTNGSMDWMLFSITIFIILIGIVMVFSASGAIATVKYHFVLRQAIFAVIGIVLMIVSRYIPFTIIYNMHYPLMVGSVVLLLIVLSPFGININGANRWIVLGSISIQPMEFTRIALALYLSYFLGTKQEYIKTFDKGLIPPVLATSLLCLLLVLQPDFGGAFILACILLVMSVVGGVRYIYTLSAVAITAIVGSILIVSSPYRMRRFLSFLDPFQDASDSGYQIVQSLYAIASGGIFGVGLGEGRQKLFYLPEAHNDFIFAIIGEELGFLGVSVILGLYMFLFIRAFRIVFLQTELRDMLITFSMSFILALSVIFNLAVVVGLLPPKGIALPFLSYGGSSLIASCICVGILLRFSSKIQSNIVKGVR
ncbi:MAG: putative lipid II flippase FtsW [Desulfovibrionaceae bacterium]